MKQKICVMGLGYIGLPTSALLANRGYQIHGVDISQQVVDTINSGGIHIVEPELDTFVHSAVNSGNLVAALEPTHADIFIIAVPTPFHDGFVPNIDYVVAAAKSIAPWVRKGNLVILESTSPVGTTELVRDTIVNCKVSIDGVHFAHCPERVLPGRIMIELIENDRIVGGLTQEATQQAIAFYRTFVQGEVLETDARTAEMAKLTENSFRDVNIAFANELSMICDKAKIDVWELISLANRHPRVNILKPGCGVGGHCIAVDPWFIVHQTPEEAKLIRTAREVNDWKSDWVVEKIKNEALCFERDNGKSPVVALLGLAFKPDIDDLRESPALKIAKNLVANGVKVKAVEPNVNHAISGLELIDLKSAVANADVIVILVAHSVFRGIDFGKKTVLDYCGITVEGV